MAGGRGSYNLWGPDQDKPQAPAATPRPPPVYTIDNNSLPPSYSDAGGSDTEERGQWGNKAEFVLSCIGLSVGLGNVWRFPYLAYENGGAAFLIAYLVLQLLIGKPMYFMELVMGQFSAKGPTKVWEMNPAAKGIGVAMCIISLDVAIYYNIIMAYTLYYFFSTMQETLPWTECTDEWVKKYDCIDKSVPQLDLCVLGQSSPAEYGVNCSLPACDNKNETLIKMFGGCLCTAEYTVNETMRKYNFACQETQKYKTAAELFFYKEVIQKSDGIHLDQMGDPLWRLALCLLLSWIVVVFCLIKGIKSSGKVVYFTATFPYVILLILLVRGALLDGAIDGVEYFIIPEWDKLTDIKVWVAAAGQMFFSLSVSFGGIIMFGSYNKFKNQVYYDSLLISVMDLVTSIIAGFVIFTTFGGMAHDLNTKVDKVAEKGYGLAFVVYPEALSNLPPSHLWSLLFFFMLFTLGLDSEFGLMETVLTCLQDEFPRLRKHKSKLCVLLGAICYLLALPCTCPGGDYVVTIMDHYGADFSVLFLSCFEVISVMWVYGAMRFMKDVEYMLGHKPHGWPYWIFCWTVTSPILIALLFTYRMINYEAPQITEGVDFPDFAQGIGWALLTVILLPVPIFFLWRVIQGFRLREDKTLREVCHYIFAPTSEWQPNDGRNRYLLPDGTTHGMAFDMDKRGVDNPVTVSDKLDV